MKIKIIISLIMLFIPLLNCSNAVNSKSALLALLGHESEKNDNSFDINAAVTGSPGPVVTLLGKSGTFGELTSFTTTTTGQSFIAQAVPNWSFRPGQASFFSALAPNGDVIIANEPQTDNQAYATADHMAISVFQKASNVLNHIVIPTTKKYMSVTNPWTTPPGIVGGADISDVEMFPQGFFSPARMFFISAVPYHWWNITTYGEYPTMSSIVQNASGNWEQSPLAITATQIRNSDPVLGPKLCRPMGQAYNCGLAEMTRLPQSYTIAVTRYSDDMTNGMRSGGIAVLSTGGVVLAYYQYPNVTLPNGTALRILPREIEADPTSSWGDERFTVIFDTLKQDVQGNWNTQVTFAAQEFSYNSMNHQISVKSVPYLSGNPGMGFATSKYDSLGNLWIAEAKTGTLAGGNLVIYAKGKVSTNCPVVANWENNYGSTCAPTHSITEAANLGSAWSLSHDSVTRSALLVTGSGNLLPVVSAGSGSSLTFSAKPVVNLGLDKLINRNLYIILPRKGSVDVNSRTLWLPINQMISDRDGANPICKAWPCPPVQLDQWLYKFDLKQLLGK